MPISGTCDRVVVIGGGIAGLATALHLAPMPVTVIAAAPLGTGASTALAQGGIAAALGADDDPSLHAADTLSAGAVLSDPEVASRVAAAAPSCVAWLESQGVRFDRDAAGRFALGLEAAHARRRIVHAGGDGTGYAVLDALARAARSAPSIEIIEGARVTDLATARDGAAAGVLLTSVSELQRHRPSMLPARAVVLATGGLGALYLRTTNPPACTGSGLALAARAGAVLRDLEFVQFHPTAIDAGMDPMPLATEALRGEGAVLVNGRGERFMAEVPGAELAPRDVVARAIFAQVAAGRRVFLDTRAALGARLPERFPGVAALCRRVGIDPVREPIPVRPAAHYHIGGVKVGATGRTSIAGLWACGEVASTGLHGANRLASNSLVEALAFARWIAQDIAAMEGRLPSLHAVSHPERREAGASRRPAGALPIAEIRRLMNDEVGVVRNETGLRSAVCQLQAAAREAGMAASLSLRDAAFVGLLVAAAALARRESRGAHWREDYPAALSGPGRHADTTLESAWQLAAEFGGDVDPDASWRVA